MVKHLLLTTHNNIPVGIIECDNSGDFYNEQVEMALGDNLMINDVRVNSVELLNGEPISFYVRYSYTDNGDEIQMDNGYLREINLY